MPIKICIAGATGWAGSAVTRRILHSSDFHLAGAIARQSANAYIEELLPDVLEGRIEPGRVFDRVVRLDDVPDGYRAMHDREASPDRVLKRPLWPGAAA